MAKAAGIDVNEAVLMKALSKFYREPENINALLLIVSGKGDVSLRLIDHFVSKYARRHAVVIPQDDGSPPFNVYVSYSGQLDAFRKQSFDCFRRRNRMLFFYDRDKSVETTIGQLCYFRWLIVNDILAYIRANRKAIEADMLSAQRAAAAAKHAQRSGQQVEVESEEPPKPAATQFTGRTMLAFE